MSRQYDYGHRRSASPGRNDHHDYRRRDDRGGNGHDRSRPRDPEPYRGGGGRDGGGGGWRGRDGGRDGGGGYRGGRDGGRGGGRGRGGGYGRGGGNGGGYTPQHSAPLNIPETVPVPSSGKLLELKPRRMEGTSGRTVELFVNHFEVQSVPTGGIHAYDMSLATSTDRHEKKELQEKVLPRILATNAIQKAIREVIGSTAIWDGVSIIYSKDRLALPTDPYELEVKDGPFRVFHISIRYRKLVTLEDLCALIADMNTRVDPTPYCVSDFPASHEGLIFLNTLLRSEPSRRFITGAGARSTTYYERGGSTAYTLPSNPALEAWSGFFQSTALRFGRLTVNVDIATNTFVKPAMNFIDFAAAFLGCSKASVEDHYRRDPRATMTKAFNKLKGVGFITKHIKTTKGQSTRTVQGFEMVGAREHTFEWNSARVDGDSMVTDSVPITVEDYYLKVYNIRLQFPYLPLVKMKGRTGGLTPIELCFVADHEKYRHELKGNETADFIKHATAPAFVRKEKIRQNIDRLRWHENEELKEFGISIHPQLMKLDARQLPPPTPQFATGTDHDPPAAGRWNLRGKTFVKPRQLGSWGIVYFSAPGRGRIGNEPEDAVINRLEQELTRTLRNHSIRVQGRGLIMKADLMGDYEKTLREFHNKCKAQTNQRPDLVVLGLVDGSTHTYNELKRVCETEAGMASQVILLPKFASQKNPAQYLSNVSLKINLKLGGVNHILEDEFFRKQNVMLIGADTSHPAGDSMAPTISALAGTYDQKCSRYTAVTSAQIGGQEIISNFSAMGKELINRYVDVNKCQPDSILYFRDGVTDAQYISVLTTELAELKEHTTAKVTVIVCTKRHHTRFFPVQGQGDKLGNALPGTLVENHGGKDIFLVAHPGLQGTVRPTHYITVYDANNLDANTFQRIVYNLCYSYARATTAVSLVPPVYYADLACFRARSHMNPDDPNKLNEVRSSLKWTMWWC